MTSVSRWIRWWLVVSVVTVLAGCSGIPGVVVCGTPGCDDEGGSSVRQGGVPTRALGLEGLPALGPVDAPIAILEFTDFQCPFCFRGAATMKEVMERYSGQVRLLVVLMPLPFHREARPASLAALAAHRQGKFFEYQDLVWEARGQFSEEDLYAYAEALGLDLERFENDRTGADVAAELARHEALAERFGVNGVPQFYVNGESLRGARPFDSFEFEINEQLERGKILLSRGAKPVELHALLSEDAMDGMYHVLVFEP
jgi:protein-disulfide isomerase